MKPDNIQTVKKNHMVLIIVLALMVFIVFVVVGFVLNQKWLGKWQTYQNSRYQFSLEYPTNWHLGEAPTNNDGREISSLDNQVTCYAYGFANSLTDSAGKPQTLDQYIEWIKKSDPAEILEQNETKLAENRAIKIESNNENVYNDSIYALGKKSGVGLVCTYQSVSTKEKYQEIFDHMSKSFKTNLNLDGENATEILSCQNLLNRLASPPQDQQTISDTEYTEVTTTSREYWDRSRLPANVVDLENNNYTCSPTPETINTEESLEKNTNSQPVVGKVEWKCDLEYTDWQYLTNGDPQIFSFQSNGYQCRKQTCQGEQGEENSIQLCTKYSK